VKATLDLLGVVCPENYVQTLLALEELEAGEILSVVLEGYEAIANVPRSLKADGQTIVKVERLGEEKIRLLVKKTARL
jgi:TusA-related sulfurtransferase